MLCLLFLLNIRRMEQRQKWNFQGEKERNSGLCKKRSKKNLFNPNCQWLVVRCQVSEICFSSKQKGNDSDGWPAGQTTPTDFNGASGTLGHILWAVGKVKMITKT